MIDVGADVVTINEPTHTALVLCEKLRLCRLIAYELRFAQVLSLDVAMLLLILICSFYYTLWMIKFLFCQAFFMLSHILTVNALLFSIKHFCYRMSGISASEENTDILERLSYYNYPDKDDQQFLSLQPIHYGSVVFKITVADAVYFGHEQTNRLHQLVR